jgi:hypothetical protein
MLVIYYGTMCQHSQKLLRWLYDGQWLQSVPVMYICVDKRVQISPVQVNAVLPNGSQVPLPSIMRSIPAMMEITHVGNEPRAVIIHGLQDIMSAIQVILQHLPLVQAQHQQQQQPPQQMAPISGAGAAPLSVFNPMAGNTMQFDEPPPWQQNPTPLQQQQQQQQQQQGQEPLSFQQLPSRVNNGRLSNDEADALAKRMNEERLAEEAILKSRARPI